MRVTVIGAGISGLSAAYWIDARMRARGRAADVTVLEAGERAGGNVHTLREDGFLVEAGPNGWLDREPAARALLSDLGLAPHVVTARPAARHRFIVRAGRLCRVPDSPPALVSSPALSPLGKLRLLFEPFAAGPPRDVEETVFEFARRRIGSEASEYLVDAAVSGISAGDSRRLSVRAAFPLMVEMEREHGSLIRAMIARRKTAGPASLVSLDRGLSMAIDALERSLGARLRLRARARAIRREAGEWRVATAGGEVAADRLVLALPAARAAELVETLDPELSADLGAVPAAGLAVVALAYRAADVTHALQGYGHLVTRGEKQLTLGVVWESSLFDGRAPEGTVLLRAMVGGVRNPGCAELSPDALAERATAEMTPLLGMRGEPLRRWVFRWPAAIPQYERGHIERVRRMRAAAARHPGLELCGTSYDGIAFCAAIAAADRLASRHATDAAGNGAGPSATLAAGSFANEGGGR